MIDTDYKGFSDNERKMFKSIAAKIPRGFELKALNSVSDYYRWIALHCFYWNVQGPDVEALRRAIFYLTDLNRYRDDKEFQVLIDFI